MRVRLPDFKTARVSVVGDVMLDRYWTGSTQRISPEAPVPVVQVKDFEERAGGAANVALNIAALGASSRIFGVIGHDEAGEQLQRLLQGPGIDGQWVASADCVTITKLRVLSRHQQLIRLDFEDVSLATGAQALADAVISQLAQSQLLLLSDYAKGSLLRAQAIIQEARKHNIPVFVDPKGDDFSKYQGASLITPNQQEFENVVGPCSDEADIEQRARALMAELQLQAILLTRSEKGMMLIQQDRPVLSLPARARDVYDVTGAGDTVIAVLAASVAAGESLESAAQWANTAAGIVVAKLGAQSVTPDELQAEVRAQAVIHQGVLQVSQLLEQVAISKSQGEKIVFTNGCFDILHAGHVEYLEQAARLGDRLIVAVNSDASVRTLKGESRPVNPLENRMKVLSGLRCVDWVVAFDEDTPAALIAQVLPDILVKGGDYSVEQIAGHDTVQANGGEVIILHFKEGGSTSAIIERIKNK